MKHIASRDNAFYKQLKRLAQSGRERKQLGQTILDGVHLIEAYEATVGTLETLVVSDHALEQPEIAQLLQNREAVVLTEALFREAAVVDAPAGVMGVAAIPASPPIEFAIDTIVLDGVQDPGNVGTLLRTAAAAGFRQAVLSVDCAGAWSPRVLRAGQGAHFGIAIVEAVNLPEFLAAYQGTVAVTHLAGAQSLFDAPLSSPVAWVFGSEGQGVSAEVGAMAPLKIKIPMAETTESLNVGAAAAICLFESVRRRLPGSKT